MAGIEPLSNGILAWAKRAARAESRNTLTALDVLCGLYAVMRDRAVATRLKLALPGSTGNVQWASDLQALYGKALAQDVSTERMPLDETLRRVVEATFAEDASLPAERLVSHLLKQRLDPAVGQFLELNEPAPGAPAPTPLLAFLEELRGRAQELGRRLATEVLGQEAAIGMLVDAYWEASLGAKVNGPRGIFTFLGPPGVGKTLLAERFAVALQALEGAGTAFRRFDMGSFAGPQNFEQLFGTESYYKDSQPGTLSGFVAENPRAVILLDEIEKAHESTLTALLAVLDKGEVTDKRLKQVVSFRECWFIVTTNLGAELFELSNMSGVLGSGAASRGVAFEILASARRRRDVGQDDSAAALPPELVSRLAKGGAVLFRQLSAGAYLQLVQQTIASDTEAVRTATSLPAPAISVDGHAALLFLLSLLPNLDARQVVARASSWGVQLRRDAYEACRGELLAACTPAFSVRVQCGADVGAFIAGRCEQVKLHVLLVDDDAYAEAPLAEMCRRFSGAVRRVTTEAEAVEAAHRFGADVALLDLSIDEGPESPRVGRALAILKALRARCPEMPVWLYSADPERREDFDAVIPRVLDHGGARGFVPCHLARDNAVLAEDFLAHVGSIVEEAAYHKLVWQMRRSHVTLAFDTECRLEGATIEASLTRVRQGLVVNTADQTSAIRFSGIPPDRFASLVGLSRAKRRLSQVVGWLRDPAALAPFGVMPPRGLLLSGPPGTGKTLLAKAVAGEAGLPFLALSAGELQSKWYGESEERVRDLFRRAREYAPSLVFIDEIDAIGQRREGDSSHVHSVLDQLLACMDGLVSGTRPVFILAATNHAELLDSALTRPGRFDEVIPIDLPNAAAREEFFRLRLATLPVAGTVDVSRLVKLSSGMSPAQLDRVIREAAYAAAAAGMQAVSDSDLVAHLREVRFGAAKEGIEVKPEERRLVAFHEAGHAVVQLRLFPHVPVDFLTIVPTEQGALGFLAPGTDETSHLMTRLEVEGRLAVLLGGREAERLGACSEEHASSGAASDIRSASRLAWWAVSRWGLDGEIGPIDLAELPEDARGVVAGRATARVEVWLKAAAQRARALLDADREALSRLVDLLLERESLDGEELQAQLDGIRTERGPAAAGTGGSGA